MCCYEYSWDAHTDLDNPKNTPEEWPRQSKREKGDTSKLKQDILPSNLHQAPLCQARIFTKQRFTSREVQNPMIKN